jgi:hypothetical protein
MQISIGDDSQAWARIRIKPGYSKILLQFRGEADGFTANSVQVRAANEFSSTDAVDSHGFIMVENDTIVLPGVEPWEVRAFGGDFQTAIRVCYLP